MTDAAALLALAGRCEREEPSFELDRSIMYAAYNVAPVHQSVGDKPKPYTTSLDAAVTLVPEGWIVERLSDCAMGPPGKLSATGCKVELVNDAHDGPCVAQADAETRALALCAAALRVRAALANTNPSRPT